MNIIDENHQFGYNFKRYREAKEITTSLLVANVLRAYDGQLTDTEQTEIAVAIIHLEQLAKKFEVVRWMSIQEAIDKHNSGVSAKASDFKLLAMSSAGRLVITISDTEPQGKGKFGGAYITLIGEDGNPGRMGIQGLCATNEEAQGLLNAAIERMPNLKADSKVGF